MFPEIRPDPEDLPADELMRWKAIARSEEAAAQSLRAKQDALLSVFRLIAKPGRADEDAAQALTDIRQIARRVLVENK